MPCGSQIVIDSLRIEPTFVQVRIHAAGAAGCCPVCGKATHRVHSRYERTLRDLPWRGTPVLLLWSVRRFFCGNADCPRLVFAEQVPSLALRRAQSTPRFSQTLVRLGLEAGGEPGARLSLRLGIVTSGDTILRRLRSVTLPPPPEPTVIGVDDFALRRGQTYGTIFVDHQSRKVIDLIPERSSAATARWLRRHDSIALVTRDRSGLYASGITAAHPEAIQVADRWHLLANSRDTLVRVLDRHHREINTVMKAIAATPMPNQPDLPSDSVVSRAERPAGPLSKARQDSIARRERRLHKYQEVLALRDQNVGFRAICRQMGMGRRTLRRFLAAGQFPEHAKRNVHKSVDRFAARIRQWWDEGEHNARQLHRRAVAEGYIGSHYTVRRMVAPWRDPTERCSGSKPVVRSARTILTRVSSNRLSWLLLQDDIQRTHGEGILTTQLLAEVPAIRIAHDLCRAFRAAVKERSIEKMVGWMRMTAEPDTPNEVRRFGAGLRQDWSEVRAAIMHPWSNGRTEGHVNRVKLIKRKMYGRAKFDLLRIRVLASGP